MRETNIDIRGGHSQVNPAATQAIQNNYYGSPIPIQDTDTPPHGGGAGQPLHPHHRARLSRP